MLDIQPNDYLQGFFEEEELTLKSHQIISRLTDKTTVDHQTIPEISNEDSIKSDFYNSNKGEDMVVIDKE